MRRWCFLLTKKVVSALQTSVSTDADQSYVYIHVTHQLFNYCKRLGCVHFSGVSKYQVFELLLHPCM